jgi:hypothetical protein
MPKLWKKVAKRGQNFCIKYRFESPKHLQQTTFETLKYKQQTMFPNYIVSKSPSETTMCLQTFIDKILTIENMHSCHIYMKWKEGASVQDSRETERVCGWVCE